MGVPNKTKVVNIRKTPKDYDVYVGRPGLGFNGEYGNPFRIGYDGSREEVLDKYRRYFYRRIEVEEEFRKRIQSLKGLRLGCFCAPRLCHADVIASYLNNLLE